MHHHSSAARACVRECRGATHSTIPAANNGLDQQMPDASFFGSNLAAAVAAGNVSVARVNDMVARILVPMAALGLLDNQPKGACTCVACAGALVTVCVESAGLSTVCDGCGMVVAWLC